MEARLFEYRRVLENPGFDFTKLLYIRRTRLERTTEGLSTVPKHRISLSCPRPVAPTGVSG